MSQSLLRDCGERRNQTFGINLQHAVISEVDHIKIVFTIERDAIGTIEEVALCEDRHRSICPNPGDRITSAICDVYIVCLPVYRDPDWPAQTGYEWLGLSLSINPDD